MTSLPMPIPALTPPHRERSRDASLENTVATVSHSETQPIGKSQNYALPAAHLDALAGCLREHAFQRVLISCDFLVPPTPAHRGLTRLFIHVYFLPLHCALPAAAVKTRANNTSSQEYAHSSVHSPSTCDALASAKRTLTLGSAGGRRSLRLPEIWADLATTGRDRVNRHTYATR